MTAVPGPSASGLSGPVTEQPYLARRQNWTNQLARHALMQPDSTALRFLGHTITWRELDRRVSALAAALHRRGVEFGDRVLILMLNRTEFISSVLAVNKLGAIAVPVNFRMTPSEIAYLLSDCQARVMVTESVLAAVAVGVREVDPSLATVIVAGSDAQTDDADPDDAALDYEALLAEPGADAPAVDIPDDSAALIMYTSGTTGRPKGAVLTHNNLAGQAMTHLFTNGADINNDIGFIGVPLFHIAGIGNTIFGLLLGRPTVLYPLGAFDPGELLDVLQAEQVTGIFLVPAQWQAVCAAQRANPRTLKLRTLSWGAAPASDTLLRDMSETFPGAQILAAFGQTEMSPVTCMLLGEDALRKLGSVGKVIPTVSARIVDEDMNDVSRLERGDPVEVVTKLKAETEGQLEVAGAALAAPIVQAGLVDEYRIVIAPTAVGGGTPFFPTLPSWISLRLLENRTFPCGTVLLRYAAKHD
ncbi:AMP-binding protein [Mycolicibacterium hippocampi]|uniref:AMP-binding protein n=1 Tax=Mycolicibacterium hippocampi TaxID=659824 RepID=UPI003519C950